MPSPRQSKYGFVWLDLADPAVTFSSWDLIGGKWKHRLPGIRDDQKPYYAVLRQAVEVLVNRRDKRRFTGADAYSTARDYWNARKWFMGYGQPAVTFGMCCDAFGVNAGEFRAMLIKVGLL